MQGASLIGARERPNEGLVMWRPRQELRLILRCLPAFSWLVAFAIGETYCVYWYSTHEPRSAAADMMTVAYPECPVPRGFRTGYILSEVISLFGVSQ